MVDQPTQAELKKRFAELPAPVQRAITSVDVQKQLREAADKHKLHLDQWEILENEVLMTLFGIAPIEELQKSIQNEVKVSAEAAAELAADISRIVFEPIRQELERQLEHPEAKAEQLSGEEQARREILSKNAEVSASPAPPVTPPPSASLATSPDAIPHGNPPPTTTSIPTPATPLPAEALAKAGPLPVMPATPPPSAPTERAVRAPTSSVYKSGESSATRKEVHEDPYREPPA